MTRKVFLFGDDNWLYCSAVSFHDGIWRGHVENGYWHLVYNSITNIFEVTNMKTMMRYLFNGN
jgi:hypothetical protein